MSVRETVTKAYRNSPDGAYELLRFALFDVYLDEVDRFGAEISKSAVARDEELLVDARRALVRSYVSKRAQLTEDEAASFVRSAALLVAAEVEVSKDDAFQESSVRRDERGRFARFLRGTRKTKDHLRAYDETKNSDRPTYQRMKAAGGAINAIERGTGTGSQVGNALSVFGELGPEAERVLGPAIRRTAYRYRGTEIRPKKDTRVLADAMVNTDAEDGDDAAVQAERSDLAVDYLLPYLPDQHLASISHEAGRVPPSRGIMVDSEGELISESVGFNGDHYVPFDLGNLRGLQGGQYARTRNVGGPSSEDLYTGLVAGARSMTVVSNSGVFTVEFDPDLRGGRRYGDQARQMVRRYDSLLKAIKGGELYAPNRDVSSARKIELRRAAAELAGYDEAAAGKIYTANLKIERAKASFLDEEEINDAADAETKTWIANQRAAGKSPTGPEVARVREQTLSEFRGSSRAESVRRYQLDGPGYAAALKALEQEFPQYIRATKFRQLEEYTNAREGLEPKRSTHAADRAFVGGRASLPDAPQFAVRGGQSKEKAKDAEPDAAAGPRPATGFGRAQVEAPKNSAYWPTGLSKLPDADAVPLSKAGEGVAAHKLRQQIAQAASNKTFLLAMQDQYESAHATDPAHPELMEPHEYLPWALAQGPTVLLSPAAKIDDAKIKAGIALYTERAPLYEGSTPGVTAKVSQMANAVMAARTLAKPFADKAADPMFAAPDESDPKPQPYAELDSLGASKANFEHYLTRMAADPKTARFATRISGADVDKLPGRVSDLLFEVDAAKRWTDPTLRPSGLSAGVDLAEAKAVQSGDLVQSKLLKELQESQFAWSFLSARRVVDVLAGEVSDPKVHKSDSRAAVSNFMTLDQLLDLHSRV